MGGAMAKLLCLAASLALHGVVIAVLPSAPEGASGDRGESGVTVQSAGAAMATLVAAWETPPEATTDAQAMADAPPVADAPRVDLRKDADPSRAALQSLTAPAPDNAARAPLDHRPVAVAALAPVLHGIALPGTDTPAPAPRVEAPPDAQTALAPTQPMAERAPQEPLAATDLRASVRPRARPAALAQAVAVRAEGSGTAPVAGAGRATTETVGLSSATRRALEAEWAATITQRIQRAQRYPRGRHGEGQVQVAMVIARTGRLEQVRVVTSSGSAALDAAALDAVRSAAPFPAAPGALDKARYPARQWLAFRRR